MSKHMSEIHVTFPQLQALTVPPFPSLPHPWDKIQYSTVQADTYSEADKKSEKTVLKRKFSVTCFVTKLDRTE